MLEKEKEGQKPVLKWRNDEKGWQPQSCLTPMDLQWWKHNRTGPQLWCDLRLGQWRNTYTRRYTTLRCTQDDTHTHLRFLHIYTFIWLLIHKHTNTLTKIHCIYKHTLAFGWRFAQTDIQTYTEHRHTEIRTHIDEYTYTDTHTPKPKKLIYIHTLTLERTGTQTNIDRFTHLH